MLGRACRGVGTFPGTGDGKGIKKINERNIVSLIFSGRVTPVSLPGKPFRWKILKNKVVVGDITLRFPVKTISAKIDPDCR